MRILVVLPLQKERDQFLQGCVEQGLETQDGLVGKMPTSRLPQLGITLATGGLGKAQFAVQTQHLIDRGPRWDAVICAGAAGALDDDLAVGDVVVGTETVEYDMRNRFGKPLLPRFSSSSSLLAEFKRVEGLGSFRVRFGAIASGDEDIVDRARRREVREMTGALANAWEGAGGARACQFSGVPFIEIRGISDNANETAARDFETHLPLAMRNIARVITAWARNAPDQRDNG